VRDPSSKGTGSKKSQSENDMELLYYHTSCKNIPTVQQCAKSVYMQNLHTTKYKHTMHGNTSHRGSELT